MSLFYTPNQAIPLVLTKHLAIKKRVIGLLLLALSGAAVAQSITVASTTSTEQSGLFAAILPSFKKASGIDVKVLALGTGQALDLARRGDADVLLVHDTAAEEQFVAEGFGVKRHPVMYNDFVLIGPQDDPAGTRGNNITQAFSKLAAHNAVFISRGDKSGTHAAEMRFWSLLDTNAPKANAQAVHKGQAYKECGCGMGQALNMAASSQAYVLADRATWLNFKNRADLTILVEGDPRLFNPYGVIAVHPAKHPHVQSQDAQRFVDWLISPAGQASIAAYKIGGQQLFFPNAKP